MLLLGQADPVHTQSRWNVVCVQSKGMKYSTSGIGWPKPSHNVPTEATQVPPKNQRWIYDTPRGVPGGSDSKAPACNAGDPSSIPGSRRSSGERNGNPTPVFFPGKFHGWRSLIGYSPCGRKESDTTEWLHSFHWAQNLIYWHFKIKAIVSTQLYVEISQKMYNSFP